MHARYNLRVRAFRISPRKTEGKSIRTAIEVLRGGGIVAFPTETVYGLCVDPNNSEAVSKLYKLKGRETAKACAHLLGDARQAETLVERLPAPAQRLARRFWPGPLTLVVPDGRGQRIGLRLPAVPVAQALAREFGAPLLQTSANRSGRPAALNGVGVAQAFPSGLDLVLDAGRVPGGVSSTVVACDGGTFEILRDGAIPAEEIRDAAVERVVLVCTGNICRSPTAEFMLRTLAARALECAPDELPLRAFEFSSCGTHGWDAAPATDEAIKVARDLGYDLTPHSSRPVDAAILGTADRVWCMDAEHEHAIEAYFQERREALTLFDPDGKNVEDPFRRSMRVYKKIAKRIETVARRRVDELLQG